MSASLHFRLFFIQREQETLGVPVVTYGESHNFPAFYSPNSGYKVELEFPALIHDVLIPFDFRAHGE